MDTEFDGPFTKMAFDEKPRKSRWSYMPKNRTHIFLSGFAVVALVSIIFIVIFNEQLHSGIQQVRESVSTCPTVVAPPPNQQEQQQEEEEKTLTFFAETPSFQTFNDSGDQTWHNLVTPNGGFIIDESRSENNLYGISMFHQLHCIQMFRNDFQELFARLDGRSDGKLNVLHDLHLEHTLHCLDYLRQVFLCYADGTIEPTVTTDKAGLPKVNGMIPHYCGNSDKWYEMSLDTQKNYPHGLPSPETHQYGR